MDTDYDSTDRNKVIKIPDMDLKKKNSSDLVQDLIFFDINPIYLYIKYVKKNDTTPLPI